MFLDPVPDLLISSLPPNSPVTTDSETLATKGGLVQGISADGVTEIVLRLPAGSPGDQFALSLKNFVSTDQDGAFDDALNPSTSGITQTSITVTAVNTNEGPMAFALYRAPLDFIRPGNQNDPLARTRTETFQILLTPKNSTTAATSYVDITLMRPPVVLVHGIWANRSSWKDFPPFPSVANGVDARFSVFAEDYSNNISISGSDPVYYDSSGNVVATASLNSLGFDINAPGILLDIRSFVRFFKSRNNPGNLPTAAVQADIVGHSMGGDIARDLVFAVIVTSSGNIQYFSPDNYGLGVIHKLITIGTPHLGSPLAGDLIQVANSCVSNELAKSGSFSFNLVMLGSQVNGAMADLNGDGSGGVMSPALRQLLQGQAPLRAALIAADGTSNMNGLNCTFCAANYIRYICSGNPVADNLTPQGWPTLFSNRTSDAIVPVTSQLGGLSGFTASGVIHSAGLENLNFSPPAELETGSGIYIQVIQLLNTSISDSQSFHLIGP